MKTMSKKLFFATLVLIIVSVGALIGYPRYEQYQRDKFIDLSQSEMNYFSEPNQQVNLTNDIKRLVKAKNFYTRAMDYGADPNSTLALDINERLRVYNQLALERAQFEKKKDPIKQVDKFWSQFDKALDKLRQKRSNSNK